MKNLRNQSRGKDINNYGLSPQITKKGTRIINHDGTFNVKRTGIPGLQAFSVYHWLISMSWTRFFLTVIGSYIFINLLFACIYFLIGGNELEGIKVTNNFEVFLNDFFFSAQTFTSLGYGRINPMGYAANFVASFEALLGLLSLALATGLLYGRFSRPLAKIVYSENAIIAPFKGVNALQLRIANKRKDHQIIDAEVNLMMSYLQGNVRRFHNLHLEYNTINFFLATWTVNHPIDEESPLYGLNAEQLNEIDAEILVLFRGFDDVFSQTVVSRSSYKVDDIVWGAKFVNVYVHHDDRVEVDLSKINEIERVELFEEKVKDIITNKE
jgi:inward rectifier potassium channel